MMQIINAFSLGPDARDWLSNSRQPRILHVFDHACNLINERREVLSIVTRQIGNGPFNLVIEDNVSFSNQLNAESPISIRADQLTPGNLTIRTDNATLWSPRPDWEMLHVKKDDILSQLTPLPLTDYQPLLPNSLISNLASALFNADIPSALKLTSRLAGLGNGLTPAGDDFLLGAIYAAWIIHPPEISSVLAWEIAKTAAPLTTSLSAAWLRAGGRGEASAVWHDFLNALLIADSAATQLQIVKLLSIGHTSGADALAGFISTLSAAIPK